MKINHSGKFVRLQYLFDPHCHSGCSVILFRVLTPAPPCLLFNTVDVDSRPLFHWYFFHAGDESHGFEYGYALDVLVHHECDHHVHISYTAHHCPQGKVAMTTCDQNGCLTVFNCLGHACFEFLTLPDFRLSCLMQLRVLLLRFPVTFGTLTELVWALCRRKEHKLLQNFLAFLVDCLLQSTTTNILNEKNNASLPCRNQAVPGQTFDIAFFNTCKKIYPIESHQLQQDFSVTTVHVLHSLCRPELYW